MLREQLKLGQKIRHVSLQMTSLLFFKKNNKAFGFLLLTSFNYFSKCGFSKHWINKSYLTQMLSAAPWCWTFVDVAVSALGFLHPWVRGLQKKQTNKAIYAFMQNQSTIPQTSNSRFFFFFHILQHVSCRWGFHIQSLIFNHNKAFSSNA